MTTVVMPERRNRRDRVTGGRSIGRQRYRRASKARLKQSPEHVPPAGHRLDDRRYTQLLAKVRDRHPHRVRERIRHLVPDVLEESLLAHDLAGMTHEVLEKRELLDGQRQGLAA